MNKTTRRGMLVLSAQLVTAGVLGWRMRQLQIKQADEFLLLAEENRINIRLIRPHAGCSLTETENRSPRIAKTIGSS